MKDYCKNCPMYWQGQDYLGEWDEGCELWLDGWFDGEDYSLICRMPRLIKRIYLAWYRFKCDVKCLKYLNECEDEEYGEIDAQIKI